MSDQQIAAMSTFCAVLAVGLLFVWLTNRRERVLQRQLTKHIVQIDGPGGKRLERITLLKEHHVGSIPAENPYFSKLSRSEAASFELIRSGRLPRTRHYMLVRIVVASLMFAVVAIAVDQPIFGIVAALIGFHIPRLVLRRQGQKRIKAFEAQLAESIDLLVGALRAGHGFLQGLESVAQQMSSPTRDELRQVLDEVNVGVNPDEALQAMSTRVPSYDLGLLVSAIAVQRQTGGNLAEVLENLAATVRERRRVRGEVMALTTGPRVSSYVLAAIPVLLFLYFFTISADYRRIMTGTTYGWMLLVTAGVLSFLGYITSSKVAKVEY